MGLALAEGRILTVETQPCETVAVAAAIAVETIVAASYCAAAAVPVYQESYCYKSQLATLLKQIVMKTVTPQNNKHSPANPSIKSGVMCNNVRPCQVQLCIH